MFVLLGAVKIMNLHFFFLLFDPGRIIEKKENLWPRTCSNMVELEMER